MENRIKSVMASVLDISPDVIDDTTAPGIVEQWDSLKQMNLVIALEEEFGVMFSDAQVADMLNFKLIKAIVSEACESYTPSK